MIVYIRKFPLLLFVIGITFSVFSQSSSDSFKINSFNTVKEELKKSLLQADDLEHSGKYLEAYIKYTEVGKMASEAGKLDYANDIVKKLLKIYLNYDICPLIETKVSSYDQLSSLQKFL